MDKQRVSFTLGSRLEELRKSKGLTHVALAKQLKDNYGIEVSRDSLMAYEISSEFRAKASKLPNLGMRTEYLYCLADFYGVSLDYLLGRTDTKSADCDMQYMVEYTGLSEETLLYLNERAQDYGDQPPGDVLYWPNAIAILINAIAENVVALDDTFCFSMNTAACMKLSMDMFYEERIPDYANMSQREKVRAQSDYFKDSDSEITKHQRTMLDLAADAIDDPALTVDIDSRIAEMVFDNIAKDALTQLYLHTRELYNQELRKRVQSVKMWENRNK